jgi:type II secretory pathway component PulF
MTTFAYTALDASGSKKSGFIEALNAEAATAKITAEGRYVLSLKEHGRTQAVGDKRPKKVTKSDLALFTRRLADLSSAGLPLDRVLQVVAEQAESSTIARITEQALEDVRSGVPVSDALAKHPKYFSTVYTQTLRAGEASGQLPQVAGRLAEFQEIEVARRSQIVSALIYPAILAATAVGVVIFLLTFVVPRLSAVFDNLKAELPLPTRILLAITGLLTTNAWLVIGAIVASIVGYRLWMNTEGGQRFRDRALLRLPALGPVVTKATVSRFARVLATLVYGGVSILDSIRLAGLATGNRVFMDSAQKVEESVRDGEPIAEAMRDTGVFPPVVTHMVAIGEETGDLPKMLNRVADSLDFEVDNGTRRLTALVEPIIVLSMGLFVGFVVLSVLLPIFAAQEAVR